MGSNPTSKVLFTNFTDIRSLIIYLAAFLIIIPLSKLIIQSAIVYWPYLLLQLKTIVAFRKVVLIQFCMILVDEVIKGIFGLSHLFFLPLRIQPAFAYELWSIRFSHMSDPFGLVNWGYIINIPFYWIALNIALNLIPVTLLFFLTKAFLGLSGNKRFAFWLILSITSLSIITKI